jgi:hypothetical protein
MRKTANKGWQITVRTYAAAAVTLKQHPLPYDPHATKMLNVRTKMQQQCNS